MKFLTIKKVMAFGYLRLIVNYRANNYLVLRHLRCNGNLKQTTPSAPPYVTKTIQTYWDLQVAESLIEQKVRAIRKSRLEDFTQLEKRMKALCHQLGFKNFQLETVSKVTPYFLSKRSGILGIPVVYELRIEHDFPKHCVADPLGRRNFIFLPYSETAINSIPIYENLKDLIPEWEHSSTILALDDDDFLISSIGTVFSLDIQGYGKLVTKSEGNLMMGRFSVQSLIRSEVIRIVSKFLRKIGLPVHQFTGDGAVFCIPANELSLQKVIEEYLNEVCRPVEKWNDLIKTGQSSGQKIGTRLVILEGEFKYGRIAGADSIMPTLDGQSLIDITRLDQGYKDTTEDQPDEIGEKHVIVSPDDFTMPECLSAIKTISFTYCTKEKKTIPAKYLVLSLNSSN